MENGGSPIQIEATQADMNSVIAANPVAAEQLKVAALTRQLREAYVVIESLRKEIDDIKSEENKDVIPTADIR